MARGDPPMPLESLVPYFRGGRFAMVVVRSRFREDAALQAYAERYIAMADRYIGAARETFKLIRERDREAPPQ